jgi:hypothetical protein
LLNLIWTDLASFATVGTKTGFESQSFPLMSPALGTRAVYKYKRIVTYSNLYYAIPALIAGLIWVFLFFVALLLICARQVRWHMLNHYVNQTSMGRTATNALFPPVCAPTAKTKKWAETAGAKELDVPSWRTTSLRSKAGFQQLSDSGFEMTYRDRNRRQRQFRASESSIEEDFFDQTTLVASPRYELELSQKLARTSQGEVERRRSSESGTSRFESLRRVRSSESNTSRFESLRRVSNPYLAQGYRKGQEDGEELLPSYSSMTS